MIKVVLLFLCISMVTCQYGNQGGYHSQGGYQSQGGYNRPQGGYHQGEGYEHHDEYAEPHYSFSYEVHDPHTGDYKSQKEERKGDHTQGEYSLVEPDGSKRRVQYKVEGKSGFIADVHREQGKGGYEQPGYQQSRPNYEPSYQRPSYHQPSYGHSSNNYQAQRPHY